MIRLLVALLLLLQPAPPISVVLSPAGVRVAFHADAPSVACLRTNVLWSCASVPAGDQALLYPPNRDAAYHLADGDPVWLCLNSVCSGPFVARAAWRVALPLVGR